jgi:hypothetical protein
MLWRADRLESGAVSPGACDVRKRDQPLHEEPEPTRRRSTSIVRPEFTVSSNLRVKQLTTIPQRFWPHPLHYGRDGPLQPRHRNGYMLFGIQCADHQTGQIIPVPDRGLLQAAVLGNREKCVDVATVILGCSTGQTRTSYDLRRPAWLYACSASACCSLASRTCMAARTTLM